MDLRAEFTYSAAPGHRRDIGGTLDYKTGSPRTLEGTWREWWEGTFAKRLDRDDVEIRKVSTFSGGIRILITPKPGSDWPGYYLRLTLRW